MKTIYICFKEWDGAERENVKAVSSLEVAKEWAKLNSQSPHWQRYDYEEIDLDDSEE